MSISINVGDQVTIVHKDFVAICRVIAARDPAIDHAEQMRAPATCCQGQGTCKDEPIPTGGRSVAAQATRDSYEHGQDKVAEVDPITNKTVIQVIHSSPRGE